MLSAELLYWYCGQTLRSPEQLFDPAFSPLLAEDFQDLPPAMIVTAGFDPLRERASSMPGASMRQVCRFG